MAVAEDESVGVGGVKLSREDHESVGLGASVADAVGAAEGAAADVDEAVDESV